jgi:hypothetical protein
MSNHPTDKNFIADNNNLAQDAVGKTDMPFAGTPAAFKERCAEFLVVLCNDKDMEKAARYLAPHCLLIHEDHPPVKGPKAFIEVWRRNLMGMPDYHKDIKDMVVEMEAGEQGVARVWVYSQIIGIVPEATTDSIDMMRFTAEGLYLESKDVQRTIKKS